MEKNEVFEVLEKELVGLANDIKAVEQIALAIERELNRVWKEAVKDIKAELYIEIEHGGYPLYLTNDRLYIQTWRYHSTYGRWLKHNMVDIVYDIDGKKEVSDWKADEFLSFIEHFDSIVEGWIAEIRRLREMYRDKKIKEALEKLEKALEILSKSF